MYCEIIGCSLLFDSNAILSNVLSSAFIHSGGWTVVVAEGLSSMCFLDGFDGWYGLCCGFALWDWV